MKTFDESESRGMLRVVILIGFAPLAMRLAMRSLNPGLAGEGVGLVDRSRFAVAFCESCYSWYHQPAPTSRYRARRHTGPQPVVGKA